MRKLNDRKVRWIIREIEKGSSMSRVARIQGVSRVRVWQLWREYMATGEIPRLRKPGRKPVPIPRHERELVFEMYERYKLGPLALERKIRRETGQHIPHNKIYRIMLEGGLIVENPRKKRQRRYVRFERTHSMSMWQGDWKQVQIDGEEKWLIAFMDDASRRIMCYGIYDHATTENTIRTLRKGFRRHGCPMEILTDHGTQFTANKKRDKKGHSKHPFPEFLRQHGIKHILARVQHPQTNGKIERFFGTLEQKLPLFNNNIHELIHWYNYDKPHMSLDFENAETPEEAFWRKLPPEKILEYAGWLLEV